ncbi:M56 family metallopeptidase [Pseudonocardia sp. KRD291]|uniref:M56 family metallopeptidase n=1 Tax=Pseudonocardia sp. KRD291 TaxID=2792007 RepID=UPI001C4A2994|nr:M56 family metallopeptidase [Pseudonocardia sp. KRD291]MBW0104400.1 M56 family metallopeptidase [Pseudonocardia sp. KRD291]
MTAVVVLLLGVVLTGVAAPRVLCGLERTSISPSTLLWLWWSVVVGSGVGGAAALAVLVMPSHDRLGPLTGFLAGCWAVLGGSRHSDAAAGLVAGLVIGAVVTRGVWKAGRSVRAARLRSRTTLRLLAPAGRWERDVLWLEYPDALAFSLGGPDRAVVMSNRVGELLSPSEVDAVVAHERAHLAGRHHLQVLVADALASAAPMVPLYRQAPGAIRRLIELAADDEAARQAGAPVVHRALLRIAVQGGGAPPAAALGASGSSGSPIEGRLDRLAHPNGPRPRLLRLGERVVLVATGLTAPLSAGVGLSALLFAISCA